MAQNVTHTTATNSNTLYLKQGSNFSELVILHGGKSLRTPGQRRSSACVGLLLVCLCAQCLCHDALLGVPKKASGMKTGVFTCAAALQAPALVAAHFGRMPQPLIVLSLASVCRGCLPSATLPGVSGLFPTRTSSKYGISKVTRKMGEGKSVH